MKIWLTSLLVFVSSICFADTYSPPHCVVNGYDVPIINTSHYVFPSGKAKDSFVAESFLGEDGKPVIIYNGKELLKHVSSETVTFIVHHECQHFLLGHVKPEGTRIKAEVHRQHELEADCEAAKQILYADHFTNKQLLSVIEDVRTFQGGKPSGRSGEETSEIIEICTSHFTNVDGCGMPITQEQLQHIGAELSGVDKLDVIMRQ